MICWVWFVYADDISFAIIMFFSPPSASCWLAMPLLQNTKACILNTHTIHRHFYYCFLSPPRSDCPCTLSHSYPSPSPPYHTACTSLPSPLHCMQMFFYGIHVHGILFAYAFTLYPSTLNFMLPKELQNYSFQIWADWLRLKKVVYVPSERKVLKQIASLLHKTIKNAILYSSILCKEACWLHHSMKIWTMDNTLNRYVGCP